MEENPMRTGITFFGAVALVLTMGAAVPQFGQDAATASSDADGAKHSLAIKVLRAINTAELAYRTNYGSYARWEDLASSREFTNLGTSLPAGNQARLADAHFSEGPEILPGWSLRLDVTHGGEGYDLLLEDTTDKTCGYAAATDERGLVRQSKAIDCSI
jgi:hypothetical protein